MFPVNWNGKPVGRTTMFPVNVNGQELLDPAVDGIPRDS